MTLLESIKAGAAALQMWLDMGDCECETATHICGKPKIEAALAGLVAAESAAAAQDAAYQRAREAWDGKHGADNFVILREYFKGGE